MSKKKSNKGPLNKVKKFLTNKKNVSPASNYVRAVRDRNKAIEDAFNGNF